MPELFDNFNHTDSQLNVYIKKLSEKYETLLPSLSRHTVNVLTELRNRLSNEKDFFYYLFNVTPRELMQLPRCGKQTQTETLHLIACLKHDFHLLASESVETKPVDYIPKTNGPNAGHSDGFASQKKQLPSNIDDLLPVFLETTKKLSTRSAKKINYLFEVCDQSLTAFHDFITDFKDIQKMRSIGPKSGAEIKEFIQDTKDYLDNFSDEQSVVSALKHHLLISSEHLGLPTSALASIMRKEAELGHFPVFLSIQEHITQLPTEEKAIIDGCLTIYKSKKIPSRDLIAKKLSLSVERVRQKRNKIIKNLSEHFTKYKTTGIVSGSTYDFRTIHIDDSINETEGTDFSLNFISWVLSHICDDVTLIGDVTKCVGSYYGIRFPLCVVPSVLAESFDFDGFLQTVRNTAAHKRINDELVKLSAITGPHFKTGCSEDCIQEIESVCRTILFQQFNIGTNGPDVVFPANSRKNNPIIAEEILRETGRPMSLEEIYNRFTALYPDRNAVYENFRGNIHHNKRIIPIGRTSRYALAEWTQAEHRGGTIRSFVRECLDASEAKIVSVSEVTDYVRKFRPETDQTKILSNLSQDSGNTYKCFFKEGEMYVGYTAESYPTFYFPYDGNAKSTSNNSIKFPALLKFISEKGRFPMSGNKEDYSLYIFWRKRLLNYKNGTLDEHSKKCVEIILQRYGHLQPAKVNSETSSGLQETGIKQSTE